MHVDDECAIDERIAGDAVIVGAMLMAVQKQARFEARDDPVVGMEAGVGVIGAVVNAEGGSVRDEDVGAAQHQVRRHGEGAQELTAL